MSGSGSPKPTYEEVFAQMNINLDTTILTKPILLSYSSGSYTNVDSQARALVVEMSKCFPIIQRIIELYAPLIDTYNIITPTIYGPTGIDLISKYIEACKILIKGYSTYIQFLQNYLDSNILKPNEGGDGVKRELAEPFGDGRPTYDQWNHRELGLGAGTLLSVGTEIASFYKSNLHNFKQFIITVSVTAGTGTIQDNDLFKSFRDLIDAKMPPMKEGGRRLKRKRTKRRRISKKKSRKHRR